MSDNILQNLEAGRKHDLRLSQFINIAMALKVAPSFLLAPMGRPHENLDLVDLGTAFSGMTVLEFDSWLTGSTTGAYTRAVGDERNERNELAALRELEVLLRERRRLLTMLDIEQSLESTTPGPSAASSRVTATRLALADEQIKDLGDYLLAAGWNPTGWAPESSTAE